MEGGITIPTAVSSADAASSALAAALGSVGAIAAPTATVRTRRTRHCQDWKWLDCLKRINIDDSRSSVVGLASVRVVLDGCTCMSFEAIAESMHLVQIRWPEPSACLRNRGIVAARQLPGGALSLLWLLCRFGLCTDVAACCFGLLE
jgi:hypothetical protein